MQNISIKELIAEVESKFPVLAESGDIDKTSIYTTLIREMRKFGVDALQVKSEVISVRNSRGVLPDDFKLLKGAYSLTNIDCEVDGNRVGVTDSFVYREYISNPARYDVISGNYITSCESEIVTELITINQSKLKFKHKRQPLELVQGINPNSLHAKCENIRIKSPHKINITDLTLSTNFNDGKIYIEYYALPTNVEGIVSIPIFSTGALYNYIEHKTKIEIAEYLIANNLNPQGIQSLYQLWKQEERQLKGEAMTEVKMTSFLNSNWSNQRKVLNRRDYNKYNPYR